MINTTENECALISLLVEQGLDTNDVLVFPRIWGSEDFIKIVMYHHNKSFYVPFIYRKDRVKVGKFINNKFFYLN